MSNTCLIRKITKINIKKGSLCNWYKEQIKDPEKKYSLALYFDKDKPKFFEYDAQNRPKDKDIENCSVLTIHAYLNDSNLEVPLSVYNEKKKITHIGTFELKIEAIRTLEDIIPAAYWVNLSQNEEVLYEGYDTSTNTYGVRDYLHSIILNFVNRNIDFNNKENFGIDENFIKKVNEELSSKYGVMIDKFTM